MLNDKDIKRIKRYFHRTAKNKSYACAIFLLGLISAMIDGDITFLLFAIIVAVPLFFARYDWMGQ